MQIIFLTYIDRSGSTFLMSHLGRVENCVICPEAEVLPLLFLKKPQQKPIVTAYKLNRICNSNDKLRFWQFTPDEISVAVKEENNYKCFCKLLELYAVRINRRVESVVFKAFEISLFIPDLLTEHKIIKMLRDPRDIFLSQRRNGLSKNPVAVAKYWNSYYRRNNKSVFTVRYENLVTNFDVEFETVVKYLFDHKVILTDSVDYSFINSNDKKLHKDISVHPDSGRVERWRDTDYVTSLYIIEQISVCGVDSGYEIYAEKEKPHTIQYIMYMAFYYTLFMVINRYNIILWRLKRLFI